MGSTGQLPGYGEQTSCVLIAPVDQYKSANSMAWSGPERCQASGQGEGKHALQEVEDYRASRSAQVEVHRTTSQDHVMRRPTIIGRRSSFSSEHPLQMNNRSSTCLVVDNEIRI